MGIGSSLFGVTPSNLDGGYVMFLAFTGLLIGTPTAALYLYGLFFFSRRLGETGPSRARVRIHFALTAAMSMGLFIGMWHIPADVFLKFFLSISGLLLHAVPMTMGYFSGKENLEKERRAQLELNTMRLLMEWERDHLQAANEYQE